jgi:hypothetical protein
MYSQNKTYQLHRTKEQEFNQESVAQFYTGKNSGTSEL